MLCAVIVGPCCTAIFFNQAAYLAISIQHLPRTPQPGLEVRGHRAPCTNFRLERQTSSRKALANSMQNEQALCVTLHEAQPVGTRMK